MWGHYENISKNNWTVFKTKRDQLHHKNTLVSRIRKDDVEFFKELLRSPEYDIDKRIVPTLYAQSSYLQNHPTLIQVAAFFDSFSPENSDSNIISSALNCFRSYIISYKKSYVVKNVRKYLLHKKNIKDLRKLWDKDSKMQKKEI